MLIQSDVYTLINYFSFTLWLWTGIATAALVKLRISNPDLNRPIKFPLILPIFFTAACLLLTVFAIYSDPIGAAYGSLLFVLGLPVYYLQRRYNRSDSRTDGNRKPSNLTACVQKLLLVSLPDHFSASTDL